MLPSTFCQLPITLTTRQVPAALSFDVAAALPVAYGTGAILTVVCDVVDGAAHVGLVHRAHVQKGDVVLVTAAAGCIIVMAARNNIW